MMVKSVTFSMRLSGACHSTTRQKELLSKGLATVVEWHMSYVHMADFEVSDG